MEKVEVNSERWLDLKDLEGEEWKVIEDFPNYSISNYGRIKRLPHMRSNKDKNGVVFYIELPVKIVKLAYNKQGYVRFRPTKDGKLYCLNVHRCVAKHFVPNPNNYPVVNHIDENKSNNYYKNLEFCTYMMNSHHGTGIERQIAAVKAGRRATKIAIDQYTKEGEFVHHFSTKGELDDAGFLEKTVLLVCRGKQESSQGYVWRFTGEPFTYPKYYFHDGYYNSSVTQYSLESIPIRTFKNVTEAARSIFNNDTSSEFKIGRNQLYRCCHGVIESAYGYIWKYAK